MGPRYLTVDGMLSGTGIRDSVEGGYLDPGELGVSAVLTERIVNWLARYERAHYVQFADAVEVDELDREGRAIAAQLQEQLPQAKIQYFSDAKMRLL